MSDISNEVVFNKFKFISPFLCMCCGCEVSCEQWAYGRNCSVCDTGICQTDDRYKHENPKWYDINGHNMFSKYIQYVEATKVK